MIITSVSFSCNAKESPEKPFLGTRAKTINEKGEVGMFSKLNLTDIEFGAY